MNNGYFSKYGLSHKRAMRRMQNCDMLFTELGIKDIYNRIEDNKILAIIHTNLEKNIMKKTLITLSAGLLMASATQAAITLVDLDIAASGNYTNAEAQVVSTAVTYDGATFNIDYTLGATANNTDPATVVATSNGNVYGVFSDTDIPSHATTLEGNDAEGISFLNLSISNFNANASSYVIGDFTNLRFRTFTAGADGNAQDGAFISFTSFADAIDAGGTRSQQTMNANGGTARDLTTKGNYSAAADDLFLIVDTAGSKNRFNIGGLAVSFDAPDIVPEPSSTALLGLGGLALIMRRRK